MLETKISAFCEVSISHDYYLNSSVFEFEINPTKQTADWMKKAGMFIKSSGSSITIGYSQKTLKYFEDESKKKAFRFILKNKNRLFQNISEGSFYDPQKKLFYFDNLDKQEQIDEAILLHKTAYVSKDMLLNYRVPYFEYPIKEVVGNLIVENWLGEKVFEETIEDFEKRLKINIDLRREPSGYYNFKKNGESIGRFYLLHSGLGRHFGYIHLFFDKNMLLAQGDSKEPHLRYKIRFENRKTIWRYYFLGLKQDAKPSFQVTHPKSKVTFSKPQQKKLIDGSIAWELVSNEAIPLVDAHEDFFKLEFNKNKEDNHPQFVTLPSAEAANVKGFQDKEKTIAYSDIYVYLG